ncbi:T9SS type A sorting domain-containing protein [Crocinitomix catalasitica]|uniref:T9SS type A sorting domain-containing protein n=1 Tax=Crocinitomix catalasitica TaxID=184607 RepID=UPI000AE5CE4C|nr:T9SS type A sorting domain-containing protein [Crocinitomix catalasitica]
MSWIDFTDQFKIKLKASFDGGLTWSEASTVVHVEEGYTSADPSISFNAAGDVFVCFIDFTGTEPPVTGGVYVSKSTDGGLSWGLPSEVITTSYDGSKWPIDRPWIEIDKSGGIYDGTIYISSMNLNRDNPPFRPYLSVSNDGGSTFTTTYLDTEDWYAGSINPLPLCSPTLNSNGDFYGSYPSYVITQSPYAQVFLAKSTTAGADFSHQKIITHTDPTNLSDYPSAKKASLLRSDPSDPMHLAFLYLSATSGDLDIYLTESYDEGENWTAAVRINDDPLGNDKMQDLLWADFDEDGDLIVSWRDRRNGRSGTYETSSEIWAAFRDKDALAFSPNFQITNTSVVYDTILASAGNDFMCIKIQNDTINATWGDTRDGRLNIWFQSMRTDGTVLSVQKIASDQIPKIVVYPNPTNSIINIGCEQLNKIHIFDTKGTLILVKENTKGTKIMQVDLSSYPAGNYIIEAETSNEIFTEKIVKY